MRSERGRRNGNSLDDLRRRVDVVTIGVNLEDSIVELDSCPDDGTRGISPYCKSVEAGPLICEGVFARTGRLPIAVKRYFDKASVCLLRDE